MIEEFIIFAYGLTHNCEMKTYGYIKKTYSSQDMNLAKQQLTNIGCDTIIYDEINNNVTRPRFKELVGRLKTGDTLVIYRFGNVIRSVIQVSMLLQTCLNRGVRIISTNDRIDTAGCPGENWQDMLMALPAILRSEQIAATSAKNADLQFAVAPPSRSRFENKEIRNNIIIELYLKGEPADQICDQTGVSHTSLFRILREHNIKLFRHGQSKNKSASEEETMS